MIDKRRRGRDNTLKERHSRRGYLQRTCDVRVTDEWRTRESTRETRRWSEEFGGTLCSVTHL